jgi:hypothetical protein
VQLYNLGGPETLSRAQLALKAAKAFHVDSTLVRDVPRAGASGGTRTMTSQTGRGAVTVQSNTGMDVALIQKELGFKLTPADLGLQHAVGTQRRWSLASPPLQP